MGGEKKKNITIYFVIKETFLGGVNAIMMILAGVLIASFFIYKFKTPELSDLSRPKFPETSVIYDRTGEKVLYEIHGEENRKFLSHEEIPEVMRIATISAEDKEFYNHFGIDPMSIIRAMKTNIERNGIVQGGSTVTQQLARNVFLTREKTLWRKYIEALIAIKIERNFTKDEILDLYLNEVPYGSNAYGVGSAAETFFGKEAKDLTLSEAVFLASLPKAPTYYSPYGNNTSMLRNRYQETLGNVEKLDLASKDEIESARKNDILSEIVPFSEPIVAPHFVFYVIENLEEQYGREFLEKGGLRVTTTIDMDLQAAAEKSVKEGVARNLSRGASNAALVAIDPKTGEVLAMVGSKDYFDTALDGQVNVTTRERQPGSSFKPIVYATAFERGYQPESLVADVPTDFGPDGGGRDYIPRNYDGKFHGVLPMRKTLAMSLNIPAIKTLRAVGIDNAISMAHRLGITTINDNDRYGLSLAIGGAEVRPIDLTAAFSVFANDGMRNKAHGIREILDKENDRYVFKDTKMEVLDPQVARKINSVLSDNDARSAIFGPRSPLYIPGRKVAAKTGTTQEFRDAWTVGYTPSIAVGVWAGNNNSNPMKSGSDGVFVAAPIWRSFMDQALAYFPSDSFISYDKEAEKKVMALDNSVNLKAGERAKEKKNNEKDKKKNNFFSIRL